MIETKEGIEEWLNDSILDVRDLKVEFRSHNSWRQVVKGVNFSLKKGETLALVGESGSGKSVSALSIMGLLDKNNSKITSGSAIFAGKTDLLKLKESEQRAFRGKRIAMIFQEPMTSLNPVCRCGSQVEEMILQHEHCTKSQAKEKTLKLFEEVLLPQPERIYKAYPHELSGGQRQRVMIAMAISCNPDVLIADEPTTALDVSVQAAVLDLIKTIQLKYGMGVLFITHDLGIVRMIADRVAVIYQGEIVETGTKQDIFSIPQHLYTRGLLACRPPLDARPERLPTVADYMSESSKELHFITPEQRAKRHTYIYNEEPILQVRDLRVEYLITKSLFGTKKKTFRAVDEVSFDLYKGETLGLVGESGCGKSTLGRAIMSLVSSEAGSVSLQGRELPKNNKSALKQWRRDVQIIFQDPYSSLNPRIRIGDAIGEPLKTYNIEPNEAKRKARVMEIMKKVGLEESFYERYPHEFSGGQRQRVGIARALVLQPKIVICDESVSALDVSVQAQVLNLLSDLKEQMQLTYIFISHDLAVVKYFSDRMMIMRKGKLVQIGEADAIYAYPQDEYTKTLIEAIPT